jgi:restriction system protein
MATPDVDEPLWEVRSFLQTQYDQRLFLDPRVFERTVASVFGGLGYSVEVTAYSGDLGIDMVLSRGSDPAIGVQVKRWADKIEAEQIRSFAGALLRDDGYTKGIFVTTSSFTRGASKAAGDYLTRLESIELMDAIAFYDSLGLVRASEVPSEASAKDLLAKLTKISSHTSPSEYSDNDFG